MNTAFDIKLEAKDLFRFNMYQTYTGLQGWISIILGILAWGTKERIKSHILYRYKTIG